tara:strand:+ start:559 stop:1161 length:603 start_codon:yes stop_codon:yes gene_type:complete
MLKIRRLIVCITCIIFLQLSPLNSSENKNLTAIGSNDAKVTVKVFSSLSCPHCAHFHNEIFEKLKRDYIDKDRVRFEHHSFPLDLQALNAEKILKCFKDNNKKFNFLSEIYKNQESWYRGKDINNINLKLTKIAEKHGINNDKITFCLNDESLEDEILSERIMGNKKYSIKSTPTVFINEKKYQGEYDYEEFAREIEKLL